MRIAWLLSVGIHASLICVLTLQPFGLSATPPRAGIARIGFDSEESVRLEARTTVDLSEPDVAEPETPPPVTLALPLLAEREPRTPFSDPPTARIPARRLPSPPPSSTTIAPTRSASSSRSDGAIAPPSPLANPEPRYPAEARRRGWQGQVLVVVRVGTNGTCLDARVLSSSGHACLDEAALVAVRRWTFSPATRDGVAIEAEVEVPITFVLR